MIGTCALGRQSVRYSFLFSNEASVSLIVVRNLSGAWLQPESVFLELLCDSFWTPSPQQLLAFPRIRSRARRKFCGGQILSSASPGKPLLLHLPTASCPRLLPTGRSHKQDSAECCGGVGLRGEAMPPPRNAVNLNQLIASFPRYQVGNVGLLGVG